jgi:PQQ-dependent catabolism-associated CXXCW motif protein
LLSLLASLAFLATGCTPWQQVKLDQAAYDNETQDFGVTPTLRLRGGDYEAPTPLEIAGATTITTPHLRDMLLSAQPPLLIDVLDGNQTVSLPGAVWLSGFGHGGSTNDGLEKRLATYLAKLTGGDKARAIVVFCLSKTCWLSHNATVRVLALGYSNVYWYRGGRNAWQAAGLAMEPIQAATL